ncbi:MAG: penicillin amidase [Paracoccaceae bacterium]|jgi:penicillin amidase
MFRSSFSRLAGMTILTGFLSACSVLAPLPGETTSDDRLSAIPVAGLTLEGKVTIHWDDHQVPFIEAERDADLPVAMGLVHAHLRLGQMELLRRISQGRIAEMGGPLATDIDEGLRILNFGAAAEKMEAALPPETRAWLEGYVRGVNHYQQNVKRLPQEYRVLGLEREPWTVRDVLTFGRLSGTDVNWLVYGGLLKLRDRKDWPALWARLVKEGTSSVPSFDGDAGQSAFNALLAGVSKSGSNSLAVAPSRTSTGAAIMANDPHLGITVPNIWLIMGVHSPSYHVVGLSVPGLPIFAIGRNPRIAWGGTNMRAASSDLVDISAVPPAEITTRQEKIKVRWWLDRDVSVRETRWGPVLSDAPLLKRAGGPQFALRWAGHQVSDEVGAMMNVSKATNFQEFRQAFKTFAVSGQNMLYADVDGNIGQVAAAKLPSRENGLPADVLVTPAQSDAAWAKMVDVSSLPVTVNPADGFLLSANNRPAAADVPLGYFFSPDDRMIRMREILTEKDRVDIADIKALQRDVYMSSSVDLRDALIPLLRRLNPTEPAQQEVITLMTGWDGHYRADSRGALTFELFYAAFKNRFAVSVMGERDADTYAGVGRIKTLLIADLKRVDAAAVAAAAGPALASAAEHLSTFANWGDMHRLAIAHPMGFLPVIGGRYRFADYPVGGSSHSIMKTAHATTDEQHNTRFGSNARHISDLSDMDRNYFVLLGGQDGWFKSANFLDQVPYWLSGNYIQVPMRLDVVRKSFTRKTVLGGAKSPSGN